mgnify:CR=1 FL=1
MRTIGSLLASSLLIIATCSADAAELTADRTDLFRVPLVCGAAPEIGCGSRAKPLLLQLETLRDVESAWLDRTGDHIAIVWKDARLTRKQRSKAIKESFTRNDVPIDLVADATEHARLFADFNGGGRWYRAAEVDALSKEEAGVIAGNIVGQLLEGKHLDPERSEDLRMELRAYFELELVKLRSRDELFSSEVQENWRSGMRAIGEKYVGAGNMPEAQIRSSKVKGCETGTHKDCCKGKSSCKH